MVTNINWWRMFRRFEWSRLLSPGQIPVDTQGDRYLQFGVFLLLVITRRERVRIGLVLGAVGLVALASAATVVHSSLLAAFGEAYLSVLAAVPGYAAFVWFAVLFVVGVSHALEDG